MGADIEDFEPGGGGPEAIDTLLQSGIAGSAALQVREVGTEPLDGAGPEQLSAQGRATAHHEADETAGGGEFGYILRWKRQWRKWASR